MWSFVGNKSNKQWIWLALDVQTKEVIGVHVGDRSRKGARKLGSSLPPVYRQCAVCYSDFWEAYEQVIPSQRHQAVGKETGQTNYIERFNCTLRQRVSRLVRKTLFFSKKIENQVGAIWGEWNMALFKSHIPLARWYFVHHYNASLHL